MSYRFIFPGLIFIYFLPSCSLENHRDTNSEQKTAKPKSKKERYVSIADKVDLKKELKDTTFNGDYWVGLEDSVLSLLAPATMYMPFFSYDTASLKRQLKDYKFEPASGEKNTYEFSTETSIIQVQYWEVEELSAEYHELSGSFIKGFLRDPNIIFDTGVRVGMSKTEFFSVYFENYMSYTDSVKTIAAWFDESANDATVYRFRNDKLAEIEFGSFNY